MSEPASRSGPDVQAAFCAVLADEWARSGVTDAVVAPGSRSTPLVLALDEESRIRVHVVLDERSAAFVALGMGRATGRPVVVVTTSGTASVEIHPAVVEAHLGGVPLLAVTTDRPPELHHVGAPQTVEQEDLFAGAVRWRVSPGVADLATAGSWRSLASRAVAESSSGPLGPGPVHVNLALREPLIGSPGNVVVPPGRAAEQPWHYVTRHRPVAPAPDDVVDILSSHGGRRGLVVAGEGAAHDESEAGSILESASRLGWPVLADPRSLCRIPFGTVVAAGDALLRVPEVAAWRPELVVTLGTPWASKVVNQWLGSLDAVQVLVDPWARWSDPERRASHVVAGTGEDLLRRAAGGARPTLSPSRWLAGWERAESAAQAAVEDLLGPRCELCLSEPAVARAVLAGLPEGGRLVVSSSMPIRDVEWFGAPRRAVQVISNRGANGIDGVLSTAIGVALAGEPVVALLGDLAFLYDASALLWAARRDLKLTVVVVDNDGGGIFSFLPQATALAPARFESYWGTPHGLDLTAVAAAYGAATNSVADRDALDALVARSDQRGVRVGVVPSDRPANVAAHDRINALVARYVTESVRRSD